MTYPSDFQLAMDNFSAANDIFMVLTNKYLADTTSVEISDIASSLKELQIKGALAVESYFTYALLYVSLTEERLDTQIHLVLTSAYEFYSSLLAKANDTTTQVEILTNSALYKLAQERIGNYELDTLLSILKLNPDIYDCLLILPGSRVMFPV